jgi:SAM-dependent methyltransferase
VSKGHDDSSRASKDHARAAKPAADAQKAVVEVEGATPRRGRAAGPRERSGPIGITSGDFSTPLVRKRTTTQPRGTPILGSQNPAPSLDEPVKAGIPGPIDEDDPVTPPPEPVATPASEPAPAAVVGAIPSIPVEAIPVAMPTRPPPPPVSTDEDPFSSGAPGRVDIDAEAAALAAEAAAVRALDSGPLTPPPELVSPPQQPPSPSPSPSPSKEEAVDAAETPTPPPEVTATPRTPPPEITVTRTPPPQLVAASREPSADVDAASGTPPPEITAMGMPATPVEALNLTPAPQVEPVTRTPAPEVAPAKLAPEITLTRTPPPELLEATRTPPPDLATIGTLHRESEDYSSPIAAAVAAAASDADQVTPPPEPTLAEPTPAEPTPAHESTAGAGGMERQPGADGASLPTLEMQANAGLVTLPAVALSDADAGEPRVDSGRGAHTDAFDAEVDGDEHVEMMEGTEEAEGGEPGPAAQAKALRAPPPIPGSHLRTPGPELIVSPPSARAAAVGPPPAVPEALAQRPRRPKRSKPWFEEVFDEDYLRTLPFMRADQTLREVEFIADALRVGPGAEILDVACGYGRHAFELVQRGYNVTGLDLSLPLLLRAAEESKRRSLFVKFVQGDMREMEFEKQFDGAYSMLTSFGYFDEDTNLRVAERIGRALKPGARFLLDIVNRDYVVSDLPVRVWWEGTGCVVLEEVDFNFHTSRIVTHRSIVFEDGRQLEQEISVRAYSLHEIGRLLRQAGFRVIDVSGGLNTRGQFFGNVSRSLLIVAEKRESDTAQPL